MAKAILIDATKREVREVECNGLADMQHFVGGYIECARTFRHGDWMVVDEEGLLKEPKHFFMFVDALQPFAGNGLIVGRERDDECRDVVLTADVVRDLVVFREA